MKKFLSAILLLYFFMLYNNLFSKDLQNQKVYNVAILIYNDVYLLDFTGPYEIFEDSFSKDGKNLFNVYTVAPSNKSIKANGGLEIVADYNIDNLPQPDILVVPGGDLSLLKNKNKLKNRFLSIANKSKNILSVCTGAFILSEAELLNGMDVTTWYGAIARLQELTPKANVVKGKRVTDNGKIITTAGVSAGIDGALHLVARLFGKETAVATAKYIEYNCWNGINK